MRRRPQMTMTETERHMRCVAYHESRHQAARSTNCGASNSTSLLKISCLIMAGQLLAAQTAWRQVAGASQPDVAGVSGGFHKNATIKVGEQLRSSQQSADEHQQSAPSSNLLFSPAAEHNALETCSRGRRHEQTQQPASLSSSMLRAFIRTNNMRAYHLDLHSYRPEAKFAGDADFVDSSSGDHQARCRRHLNHYERLLAAYLQTDPMEMTNSLEALRLADTFGRPDAGLLEGHQFWLGSYENCLEFSATLADESAPVEGQYCLALAQFPSWRPQDTKTAIKIGLCLPETCTSSMLNEQQDLFQLTERMMKYQLGGPGQPLDKLKLRSVYCLPHETSEIRQLTLSGKLLISLMSILFVVCLYASLHDYLNRKTTASAAAAQVAATARILAAQQQQQQQQQQLSDSNQQSNSTHEAKQEELARQQQQQQQQQSIGKLEARTWRTVLVESFSMLRNFEKIVDLSERPAAPIETPAANEAGVFRFNKQLFFSSITGLKCVGLIWIIAAHCFLVGPITNKNLIQMDKLTKTYLANVFLAAHLMVDTFFALSGMLASYLLFKSQSLGKMKLANWLVLTLHRYWRLTPVYLLCYWFAKSIGHLVNSGPLWDYATAQQSPRHACTNESWLEALLHLSDFKSPKAHCVPFAWFIANGIKFWIVTPIFLTAIYKSLRAGYALLLASIVANIAIVVSLAINSSVDMKSVLQFKPESADNMLNDMEQVYTRPYSRIGAYLVGLMAGHMIYLVETQNQPVNMSEKLKILIWSLVSATAIVLTFVIKIAGGVQLEESAIPWVFSFCSGIIRPLWALCTCWLVFALAIGQARWLSKILSANVWRILARLSFCAYLVQGEVIANLYLSSTYSSPYQYGDMLTRPIVATAITVALSVVVVLLVEYPLIGIEELILPKRPDKSREEKQKLPSNGRTEQQVAKVLLDNGTTGTKIDTHKRACDAIVNGNPKGEKLKEL